MGTRFNLKHDVATREKIKTSQIINRLNAFTLELPDPKTGKPVQMSSAQVKAAETLLDRVLPKLQAIEGSMDLTLRKHEDAIAELEDNSDQAPLLVSMAGAIEADEQPR